MDTGPTASSNTEADPPESGESDADSVDRRAFFRVFSRQTVTAVAQVAGMAGAVQRGTAAAVVEAVGMGLRDPAESAARLSAGGDPGSTGGEIETGLGGDQLRSTARYASAYRIDDRGLVIVDQRLAPDRIEEIVCQRAADVAFQMRTFACNGGALLAQVAAYGLALSANESRALPQLRREAELRRSAQLLTYARPTAHAVRVALERMEALARTAAGPDGADGEAVAVALAAEADTIAGEYSMACASIARSTADLLRPEPGASLRVLMLGDPGR